MWGVLQSVVQIANLGGYRESKSIEKGSVLIPPSSLFLN